MPRFITVSFFKDDFIETAIFLINRILISDFKECHGLSQEIYLEKASSNMFDHSLLHMIEFLHLLIPQWLTHLPFLIHDFTINKIVFICYLV